MNIKQPLIPPPHVLIFPLPLQGPINCNLKLAELLCISGILVTFLNTHHIHCQLLQHTDVHSRFSRYPHFSFQTVPDGLSKDHPRSIDCFDQLIQGIEAVTKPIFREIVNSGGRSSGRPVTCIIADGIFDFTVDVALENGISIFYFETLSPYCVWAYLCISKLIEDGQLPFKGSEILIRQRDLPEELLNGTKDRGCIVNWVAQEEVLACSAIYQQLNSRFVNEVWKLGMDMKDTCDRVVIEKMVMDIIKVKFENEIMQSVDMTAKLGKESIAKGGR
ncbi:hypothetical protein LguiB_029447 [Lonicera macranthoides]